MSADSIRFLNLPDILYIHENQIDQFGGEKGVLDFKLLQSALGIIKSTFDGKFLHKSIFEMAGAYCFHLCMNHPFVDGNKRIGLMSALVFLDINGYELLDEKEMYESILGMIEGKVTKQDFAQFLEDKAVKK